MGCNVKSEIPHLPRRKHERQEFYYPPEYQIERDKKMKRNLRKREQYAKKKNVK